MFFSDKIEILKAISKKNKLLSQSIKTNILQENLKEYYSTTTTIIISDRLSTILSADNIVVIENGAISEQGNHSKLVELGGVYAELFRNQELAREMKIIL